MPFYLTDLVDTGPPLRFKPRGWDQSSNWSILKLDKVKVVLWSADPISLAGVDLIANDVDEVIGAATRAGLSNLAGDGRTIPNRFGDAVGNLLLLPPNSRWKSLRSMNDGLFRVKMGDQLLWSIPDPLGPRKASKRAVDNFNRGDGVLAASTSSDSQFTWTDTGAGHILSNQCKFDTTTGVGESHASFDCDTNDTECELNVLAVDSPQTGFPGGGPSVRDVGYAGLRGLSSGGFIDIYDHLDDVVLVSKAPYTQMPVLLKMVANGSNLDLWANGVKELSTTDTSTPTGKRGGFFYSLNFSDDAVIVDDFSIQDVGFGQSPLPSYYLSSQEW